MYYFSAAAATILQQSQTFTICVTANNWRVTSGIVIELRIGLTHCEQQPARIELVRYIRVVIRCTHREITFDRLVTIPGNGRS